MASITEELQRIGSFNVSLLAPGSSIREDRRHPLHDRVLRPLLKMAAECRVYGLKPKSPLLKLAQPILQKGKGFHQLDLSNEVIRGYERLWNIECERNSIVIVASVDLDGIAGIFSHCSKPDVWSSLYQIQMGNSKAAIRYCQEVCQSSRPSGQKGVASFCLPGSNGIEWMDVFAAPPLLQKLYELSRRNGKKSTLPLP